MNTKRVSVSTQKFCIISHPFPFVFGQRHQSYVLSATFAAQPCKTRQVLNSIRAALVLHQHFPKKKTWPIRNAKCVCVYFVFLKFIFIAFSLFSFRMNFKYFCFCFMFLFAILYLPFAYIITFSARFSSDFPFSFSLFFWFCFILLVCFCFLLFFALFVYNLSQPYKLKIDINQYIVLFNEICRLFIAICVVYLCVYVCLSVCLCLCVNQ